MIQEPLIDPKSIADDELDLVALAKNMWAGRKTIIISIVTGAILGILIAISTSREFNASTVMVPQMGGDSQSKLGGIGGLAALAGINLDMNQSAELSPMVYPQIVNSIPFQLELMNTPFNFSDFSKPTTLFEYFNANRKPSFLGSIKKYTIGLPGVIIKAIKGKPKNIVIPYQSANHPIFLSAEQYAVKKALDQLITLEVNAKEGYLTLIVRMPEALAAAQIAKKAQGLLQQYITEFRIEKVKANLVFIQERYNETKTEFEKAQVSLATVSDRNRDFTSGLSLIESDRVKTRYTIAFSVYQELAKQLEQAKIQVKKETPVFTIIKPVSVPSESSKPNKQMIVIIWVFLGGIFGCLFIFGKGYLQTIKQRWQEQPEEN